MPKINIASFRHLVFNTSILNQALRIAPVARPTLRRRVNVPQALERARRGKMRMPHSGRRAKHSEARNPGAASRCEDVPWNRSVQAALPGSAGSAGSGGLHWLPYALWRRTLIALPFGRCSRDVLELIEEKKKKERKD